MCFTFTTYYETTATFKVAKKEKNLAGLSVSADVLCVSGPNFSRKKTSSMDNMMLRTGFFLFIQHYISLFKQKHEKVTYSGPGDSKEKHKAKQRS